MAVIIVFIGRQQELAFLSEKYQSANAELVVLYGRRRIGKTETLRYFSKDTDCIFFTCSEIPDNEQLKSFSSVLLANHRDLQGLITSFSSWEQAFNMLGRLSAENKEKNNRKLLAVIDEFPYMCRGNKAIPSILQKLWDIKLKNSNLMLVLCGSAMSFIEKEILGEKNPLYGRATGIYKMKPMNFHESRQFFPNYDFFEQLACYGILGGIPYYLRQFSDKYTLEENILHSILQRGSILYSEVEFLLHQELRETAVYNSIIQAIALGNNTLSLIHGKTQLENTKITVYIKNLMELGIVEREFSVLAKDKEKASAGKGLYSLTDAYFKFWYAYVLGNISAIESGDAKAVYKYIIEPELHQFLASVFENVCIEYLQTKNIADELPFHFFRIGRWWDKVARVTNGKKITVAEEIDIVAADYKQKKYIIGECKLRNQMLDADVYEQLKKKFPLPADSEVCYYLFSLSGFTEKMIKVASEENVTLISGDML